MKQMSVEFKAQFLNDTDFYIKITYFWTVIFIIKESNTLVI